MLVKLCLGIFPALTGVVIMRKILAAIVSVIFAASAMAESGQFETVSNGTVTIATNDFGTAKYSITDTRYTSRVTSSSVSFFNVGNISVSECLGILTVENGVTNGNGTCLASDADGDKWRLNYVRGESTAQTVTGTAEIIGLNGKFSNVKGPCHYDQKRLVLNGVIHVSTLLKCSVTK
jgi:hypothetical protein